MQLRLGVGVGKHSNTVRKAKKIFERKRKDSLTYAVWRSGGSFAYFWVSKSESPDRRKKQVPDVGEEAFSFHWDDILAERLGDGFTRVQQADVRS